MTKEEIEALYGDVYQEIYMQSREGINCNFCKKESHAFMCSSRYQELFNKIIYTLESAWSKWEPIYITEYNSMGRTIRTPVGGTAYLAGFCSKRCYLDYLYEHQGELVELITQ